MQQIGRSSHPNLERMHLFCLTLSNSCIECNLCGTKTAVTLSRWGWTERLLLNLLVWPAMKEHLIWILHHFKSSTFFFPPQFLAQLLQKEWRITMRLGCWVFAAFPFPLGKKCICIWVFLSKWSEVIFWIRHQMLPQTSVKNFREIKFSLCLWPSAYGGRGWWNSGLTLTQGFTNFINLPPPPPPQLQLFTAPLFLLTTFCLLIEFG